MKRFDPYLVDQLKNGLERFDRNEHNLHGIVDVENMECFIKQIIDSIRRVKYITTIRDKGLTGHCINAKSQGFNPIMAASYYARIGELEEAFWLTYLLTYFGKSKSGWALLKAFYSALGKSPAYWTWTKVSTNMDVFIDWLKTNSDRVKAVGSFSNHRKFTSFRSDSKTGSIAVMRNYFNWLINYGNHKTLIDRMIEKARENNQPIFKTFYKEIPSGIGFARLGKFDMLTMLSKLKIVDMVPDSTYIAQSTGPLSGAKLLLYGNSNVSVKPKVVESIMDRLAEFLEPTLDSVHTMQIIEDSVCNWQKAPASYERYYG